MKIIQHIKKVSAEEINDLIQKQFPGYKQSEYDLVKKDILFIKKVSTFSELESILLKEIIVGGDHMSGDTGLSMQDNAPKSIGLPIKTIEILTKKGINTIGDLRKADAENGLTENGYYDVFEFLATVERLLKK